MSDDDDDDDAPKGPSLVARLYNRFIARPLLAGLIGGFIGVAALSLALPHPVQGIPEKAAAVYTIGAPAPAHESAHASQIPAPAAAHEPGHDTGTGAQGTEHGAGQETGQPAAQAPLPAPIQPEPAKATPVPVTAEAAVLITDVGLSRRVAEAIDKQMPRETSLAISAYAGDPAAYASAFKATGRDVWLEIVSQSTKPGIDPGPLAMSAALSAKENTDLIKRQITSAGKSITGIYVPHDADIVGASDMWRDIAMNVIADNMMVLDGTKTPVATALYLQKSESKISAYLKADAVIDGSLEADAFTRALEAAIPVILHEREAIVVVVNPTALCVSKLSAWVYTLAGHGIKLVPASRFTGLKP